MTSKKTLKNLTQFISYLQNTTDEEWRVGTVRDSENKTNCCFGHLVNWYYGKEYTGQISEIWDLFEELWATTYMIYPVNDGENTKYQQATPKARIIAYLINLNTGKAMTTRQYMERDFKNHKKIKCH
jgi:hypothetical protein